MNKESFIQYMAERYGIDSSQAEGMTAMFTDCLQELIRAGQSVCIDEIGEFKTSPLFPQGIPCNNGRSLVKLAKKNMVSFKASKNLINSAI